MKDINEISTSNFNNKSNLTNEKKNWVSPEIMTWEYTNIGLKYGGGIDAGTKSYAV